MTTNVGGADKIFRIFIGLVLLTLVYFTPGNARWWWLIGLIPLATATAGWCPVYAVVGTSTAAKKQA